MAAKPTKKKNPAAVALGRLGGTQRAKNLSARERSASARLAIKARWAKEKRDGR